MLYHDREPPASIVCVRGLNSVHCAVVIDDNAPASCACTANPGLNSNVVGTPDETSAA